MDTQFIFLIRQQIVILASHGYIETDRLKAQMNVWGSAGYGGAWARTVEGNLPDTLRFAREMLREPSFQETEFEQVRQQRIAGVESQKTEPMMLAQNEMYRHIDAQYPRGDVRYVATLDEQMEELKNVKLETRASFTTSSLRRPRARLW